MYRAALATAAVIIAALYLTPSATPYSPYNTGPDGLSKTAEICQIRDEADTIIIAPGASIPTLNISASTAQIVDLLINGGDPYQPIAKANGYPVVAANATPLTGPGRSIAYTSPISFVNNTQGPFTLGLAVEKGGKTLYIYHASLFTNRVFEKNKNFIRDVCLRPVKIVIPRGDPSHHFHELAAHVEKKWLVPLLLAAIGLYLVHRRQTWQLRRKT